MAKKDYSQLAYDVLQGVGGKDNVSSVTNCMTRLRFVLKDDTIPNADQIKKIEGVKGVMNQGGQYQVIIGTHVSEVRPLVENLMGQIDSSAQEETGKKDTLFNRFFKTISGCITPMLGLMVAGGILKGLLTIFVSAGMLSSDSGTYQILYAAADSFMYFLPIIIGFAAGKVFKCNQYVTAAIGAALVYPSLVSALSAAGEAGSQLTFFGIPVINATYSQTLLPILLAAWFASKVEKIAKKIVPEMLQLMFVPALTLVVTVPCAWLFIGPLMNGLSSILSTVVLTVFNTVPVVGGVLFGAFWQLMVLLGLHGAFIPILINNLITTGSDPINAILGLTVWALAGVSLGYALKMKNSQARSMGLANMASCLCGVTEPTIYSICLEQFKCFVAAFIGGGVAGGILSALGGKMYAMAGDGLFRIPAMINPEGVDISLYGFVGCALIAFVISAIFAYFLASEKETAKEMEEADKAENLGPVTTGRQIPLEQVNDPTFSQKLMGDGIAYGLEDGNIYAPANGVIQLVAASKHAIGMMTNKGTEVLIHIGLDTVALEGQGFEVLVKEGQTVKQGDLLVKVDMNLMNEKKIDTTTMMIVTNKKPFTIEEKENRTQLAIA